jgi:hypothetical protein
MGTIDTVDDIDLTLLVEIGRKSSYREMAVAIHKSLRTVQLRLTSLEWRGMIIRSPKRKNRSLTLSLAGERMLKYAFPKGNPVL